MTLFRRPDYCGFRGYLRRPEYSRDTSLYSRVRGSGHTEGCFESVRRLVDEFEANPSLLLVNNGSWPVAGVASRLMAYKDPLDPRNREARLRHYYANKAQYIARSKQVREDMRAWVAEYKTHPCVDCGIEYPHYVMDLHHRDPSTKINEVSKLVLRGNWSLLISEAEKCDILCANCHRIRTHSIGEA